MRLSEAHAAAADSGPLRCASGDAALAARAAAPRTSTQWHAPSAQTPVKVLSKGSAMQGTCDVADAAIKVRQSRLWAHVFPFFFLKVILAFLGEGSPRQ